MPLLLTICGPPHPRPLPLPQLREIGRSAALAKQFGLKPESDLDLVLDLYAKYCLLLFPSTEAINKAASSTSVVQSRYPVPRPSPTMSSRKRGGGEATPTLSVPTHTQHPCLYHRCGPGCCHHTAHPGHTWGLVVLRCPLFPVTCDPRPSLSLSRATVRTAHQPPTTPRCHPSTRVPDMLPCAHMR
jgi:hypothetical protein